MFTTNSSIEALLIKHNISYKPTKGGQELNYNCICPNHKDRNASAFINTISGKWKCFSCNSGGSIKSFIKLLCGEDIKLNEILSPREILKFKIDSAYKESSINILSYDNNVEFINAYEFECQNFIRAGKSKDAMRYLINERGLNKKTIREFKLMYAFDGDFKERIIIPYIMDGQIIGINSRDISGNSKLRYKYFINNEKFRDFIYNYDNISDTKYCIIVEGPFDLMALYQHGYKNVISTLNTNMNNHHINKINSFDKIIFCFDNDIETKAGYNSVMKHAEKILKIDPSKDLYYVTLPPDKDPSSCNENELKAAFKNIKKIKLDSSISNPSDKIMQIISRTRSYISISM